MADNFIAGTTQKTNNLTTRRTVLKGLAVGTAGLVTGFPYIAKAKPATMTVPNSGGALEEAYKTAYFDTFQQKSGIQILGAPYMDTARVKAMVDNNAVDVDVLNIDATEAAALASLGLLEPIDYDIIDKASLLPEASKEHYLLVDVAAYVMAWNTNTFNAETRPKNWQEFFDPNREGQRSLWKLAPQTLEVAAMGGGQPMSKLYPIDLDAGFKSLDAIKQDQLTWWTSGAQGAQLIIGGEVDVGTVWNGRVFKAKLDGQPVDYTFDNALYVCDSMVIPKGAKNKKEAMEFLANMIDAKNQATFAKAIPYGPVNPKTFELLDAATLEMLPNAPQNSKSAIIQDFDYWASNGPAIFDRFNNWLLG